MGVGCPELCSPRRVPPPPSLRTRQPLRQPKSARSVTAASVAAALPLFQPGAAMHQRFLSALSLPHPCFFCNALCRAFFPLGVIRYSSAICFFGGACASAILHTTHANRLTQYNVAEDPQRPPKKRPAGVVFGGLGMDALKIQRERERITLEQEPRRLQTSTTPEGCGFVR